jgi:hypothetical protein
MCHVFSLWNMIYMKAHSKAKGSYYHQYQAQKQYLEQQQRHYQQQQGAGIVEEEEEEAAAVPPTTTTRGAAAAMGGEGGRGEGEQRQQSRVEDEPVDGILAADQQLNKNGPLYVERTSL